MKLPRTVNLPRWNARFFLPATGWGAGATVIYAVRENYERELVHLDRFLSPGDVAVDAGANCGIYTIAFGKLVGNSGRVLSFEPAAETFPILQHNIRINGLHNTKAFQMALSDIKGRAQLFHHSGGPVAYSLGKDPSSLGIFEDVATTTLDDVMQEESIQHIDFIKMDVEGAELSVLRGAKKLLSRSRPIFVLEINPDAAESFGLSEHAAWHFLTDMDYKFFVLTSNGRLKRLYAPPVGGNWEFCNVIAINGDEKLKAFVAP
jgi:FkbM family methyltransferase